MKTCTQCSQELPVSAFYVSKRDGLDSRCKECRRAASRAFRAAHLEEAKEYNRRYRQQHAERLRAYGLTYNEAHADKRKAKRKARYWADPEGARATEKARRARYKEADPDYWLLKARQKIKWLTDLKAAAGCLRCDERHPAALDFHHRDPATKSFAIGPTAAYRHRREAVMAELEKCDLLCRNCHAKLHWDERSMNRRKACV